MRFLPLLRANLGRHKRRTLLTIASVALALFLFASLRTVITTLGSAAQFGSARRLVTTNSTGFVLPLPVAYASRIQTIDGVQGVTWANWFGGRYGDGKRFFANFAVDAKSYLDLYPEMSVPADQREAFLRDRAGALVGVRLLDIFGWKVGQNVTLQGTIFPGDWTFTIRGAYTPTDPAINDDALMFHFDYLDERNGRQGQAGWYILQIDHPENAARVAKAIDDQFRNSPAPTKTGTEQAFNASFATMWGNVGLLMNTIGMAVVFAILLVTANAMMMSARERAREVAVLKTIGFTDRRLFGLVMLEAGIITVTGAVIGLGAAKLLYRATNFNAAGFLPGFDVTWSTLALGGGIALVLMLASGIVPAARAARLPVVTALRNVE
jgi:putative ABC transport system permease protein